MLIEKNDFQPNKQTTKIYYLGLKKINKVVSI